MRKLMRYVWLMPALAGLMMSCASEKTDAKALEGAWNIVEVDGEAVKAEAEEAPFIGFDMSEMSVHGKTDCNLFNASFELKPNDCSAVQLGEIITTMMACPEMELEGKVLEAISQIRSVKQGANADEMCLLDAQGTTVVRLIRQ